MFTWLWFRSLVPFRFAQELCQCCLHSALLNIQSFPEDEAWHGQSDFLSGFFTPEGGPEDVEPMLRRGDPGWLKGLRFLGLLLTDADWLKGLATLSRGILMREVVGGVHKPIGGADTGTPSLHLKKRESWVVA